LYRDEELSRADTITSKSGQRFTGSYTDEDFCRAVFVLKQGTKKKSQGSKSATQDASDTSRIQITRSIIPYYYDSAMEEFDDTANFDFQESLPTSTSLPQQQEILNITELYAEIEDMEVPLLRSRELSLSNNKFPTMKVEEGIQFMTEHFQKSILLGHFNEALLPSHLKTGEDHETQHIDIEQAVSDVRTILQEQADNAEQVEAEHPQELGTQDVDLSSNSILEISKQQKRYHGIKEDDYNTACLYLSLDPENPRLLHDSDVRLQL